LVLILIINGAELATIISLLNQVSLIHTVMFLITHDAFSRLLQFCNEVLLTFENQKKDLDTLGTHPDYQRRGAGSMLVQWECQ
jgi:ribosomal protein S18 acetylase RimI-like enzyme